MLWSFEGFTALFSLTLMEIVLGIDNIIFIAILTSKLPKSIQGRTRRLGISFALIGRLALLFSISWIMKLTEPFFSILGRSFSGRDLILIGGGLFLIAKATFEIHSKLESASIDSSKENHSASKWILFQILLLDLVFSLDSVITAVGMAQSVWIMVIAMVIAVFTMLLFSGAISEFVHRHPTIKILALSFLLLIGVTLFAEGLGTKIAKAYIYFAMAFSLGVELLNMRYRSKQAPVELHEPTIKEE